MKPRAQSRRARRGSGGDPEWIAGLVSPPFFVTDREEPYRPKLVVWIELPSGLIVGQDLVMPEATAGAVGRVLATAIEQPPGGTTAASRAH